MQAATNLDEDHDDHKDDDDGKEEERNHPSDTYPQHYPSDLLYWISNPTPDISVKKAYSY